MLITHLGHSCLDVETAGTRLLLDPGAFSGGFPDRVDAVVVTHSHADHLDPAAIAALAGGGAAVLAEAAAAEKLRESDGWPAGATLTVLSPGESYEVGGLTVDAVGGQHAVIHDNLARIGNVGVVVRDGATSLFHPGDALDTVPSGIDVLAAPIVSPWSALKESADFVAAVAAPVTVPIHDALLVPAARQMFMDFISQAVDVTWHDGVADGPLER